MSVSSFQSLVQRFFTDRLLNQLGASPHTVAAYRDTFRLLLQFASTHLRRAPSKLRMEDFDAPFLGKFLEHLELTRGNCARTRNNRLAAFHAFFRYVAVSEPALALHCQRVLAIPSKRYDRGPVAFLTEEETAALVAAPNPKTWIGQRDRALLLVAVQTGLRNSEITSLRRQDVELGTGAHVRCLGKGRKMRCTPLRPDVAKVLQGMVVATRRKAGRSCLPEFQRRTPQRRWHCSNLLPGTLPPHVKRCPSLASKKVTPHTLRHGAAMAMLRRGVDLSVIALWLGHESTETTQIYLHADMQLKERALAHATPSGLKPARFRPKDALLAFLESL